MTLSAGLVMLGKLKDNWMNIRDRVTVLLLVIYMDTKVGSFMPVKYESFRCIQNICLNNELGQGYGLRPFLCLYLPCAHRSVR